MVIVLLMKSSSKDIKTEDQSLLYLSYTTKETEGSFKHSLSTVSLWGTKAYVEPATLVPVE